MSAPRSAASIAVGPPPRSAASASCAARTTGGRPRSRGAWRRRPGRARSSPPSTKRNPSMSTASASLPIRSCTSGVAAAEQRALLGGQRVTDQPGVAGGRAPSGRRAPPPESTRRWVALIASAFLRSKRAGLGLTRSISNAVDHLLHREDVAVLGDRPAQQGQVVQQPLGQEALVAVAEQVRLRVALGELLVALTHHVGQVAEARRRARCRRRSRPARRAARSGEVSRTAGPRRAARG